MWRHGGLTWGKLGLGEWVSLFLFGDGFAGVLMEIATLLFLLSLFVAPYYFSVNRRHFYLVSSPSGYRGVPEVPLRRFYGLGSDVYVCLRSSVLKVYLCGLKMSGIFLYYSNCFLFIF